MFPKIKVKPSFNEGLPLTPKVFRIFLTDLPLKTKVRRRFLKMTIIAGSKLRERLFAQAYGGITTATFSQLDSMKEILIYLIRI